MLGIGHGMQKQDLGCRGGMEAQDKGWSSPRASRRRPGRAQGSCGTPRDGECVQGAGKCKFPRKKITAFESRTGIDAARPPSGRQSSAAWPHLPARCAGAAIWGGERSPRGWGSLIPALAGLGTPLSHITPTAEKLGRSGKDGLDGAKPALPMILIAIKLLSCGWEGDEGDEVQPGGIYRVHGPVWPSKDPGLSLYRVPGWGGGPRWDRQGLLVPSGSWQRGGGGLETRDADAGIGVRVPDVGAGAGCGCRWRMWDEGCRCGIWDADVGCRVQLRDARNGVHGAGCGMKGAGAGHGVQVQDLGCRVQMWAAGCRCGVQAWDRGAGCRCGMQDSGCRARAAAPGCEK